MREIKFRCYDLNDKVMNFYDIDGYNKEEHNVYGNIMQYTGLKDKNRLDIYENDAMRIKLPLGGFWGNVAKEKIGVVKYSEDFAGFIVEWEYSINQHHVRLDCDFAIEGEILGNIYEHPHLLNTEK